MLSTGEEGRHAWNYEMECRGCVELRRQVESLRHLVEERPRAVDTKCRYNEDGQCMSTFISERQQADIDRMILEHRRKAETYEEMFNQISKEKSRVDAENTQLRQQLKEKVDEVSILSEQNCVYANDFRLEREDRERTQGRLNEIERQLTEASGRIAQLEDEKQQLQMVVATLRYQYATPSGAGRSLPNSPSASRHRSATTSASPTYNIFYQLAPQTDRSSAPRNDWNGYGSSRDEWDGEKSVVDQIGQIAD